MKKLSWLLIICIIFSLASVMVSCSDTEPQVTESSVPSETQKPTDTQKATEKPTEEVKSNGKTVDIYIIAGQSNGSGYTRIDSGKLKSLWSDYAVGYDSVLYAGRAEYTKNSNTAQVSTAVNEVSWQNAKAGQGISANSMGVEVGMAKVLGEEYYNQTGGEKLAGIIKFAHGGTSLFDKQTGENVPSGNWVSPSYAESKGLEYSGITGGLYRKLLAQVEKNVGQLKDEGYEVSIKGLFWMQGESDRSDPEAYKTAFAYLIGDLRSDLSKLMGADLSELPIMVGEISRTAGSADAFTVDVNEAFIEMQRSLSAMYNVYTIASGQYEINTWDEATQKSVVDPVQRDGWHWNTESMFAIGELVGECIIENILE